jgi:ActR/RegA family two-component response regulator
VARSQLKTAFENGVPHRRLAGRLILLVEDEPVIALDVEKALREAGARVVTAGNLESGLYPTVHPDLSAAAVDLRLGDGSGAIVCRELQRLGVPCHSHQLSGHADGG